MGRPHRAAARRRGPAARGGARRPAPRRRRRILPVRRRRPRGRDARHGRGGVRAGAPAAVVWTRDRRPTADDVAAVALERAPVTLADDLLAAIDEGHRETLRALGAAGSVYGVTTGQG